jgi:hypothetical protein
MTTPRSDGRDANFHMSPVAKGRPRPEGIGDRVAAGDAGPDRLRGLTGMSPVAGDPHQRGTTESGHISDPIRAKLRDHPGQAGEIRRVADSK